MGLTFESLLIASLCYSGFSQTFTISFGSCNQHDKPQVIWKNVLRNDPDVWIWTGDIVYADTQDMSIMGKSILR